MKKLRIYVDTSVIGGVFDEKFNAQSRAFIERAIQGEFTLVFSDVLYDELLDAPKQVLDYYLSLPENCIERCETSKISMELANQYITHNVVGKSSYFDCVHIAIATVQNADILVSWNFKHIVNVDRKRGYNSVNLLNGYKIIEIVSPLEF